MKSLEIFKKATNVVTSMGVGAIVTHAVKFVTPIATMHPAMKACVYVGSFVLSSMISDKASAYAEEQIDEIAETAKGFLKENEEEQVTENGES